jgi:uridine kinase
VTGAVELSVSTWQQPMPPPPGPARARILERVADLVDGRGPGRTRVAVDGHTAAGKTTFGHELARELARRGRRVLRASLDDFKRPWRDRHRYDRESGEGYYRNAYDPDAIRRLLLEPARDGGDGVVALCSIDPLTQRDHSATTVTMPAGAVLVVDGVFAFRPALDDCWDLRIWLEIDAERSVARGIARDADLDGGAPASETRYRDRYLASELLYRREVDPYARADVVVDNDDFDAPRLLRPATDEA